MIEVGFRFIFQTNSEFFMMYEGLLRLLNHQIDYIRIFKHLFLCGLVE